MHSLICMQCTYCVEFWFEYLVFGYLQLKNVRVLPELYIVKIKIVKSLFSDDSIIKGKCTHKNILQSYQKAYTTLLIITTKSST